MDDVIGATHVNTSANLILEVVDRLRNYFSDFKPESKTLAIDFTNKTSTIGFRITVPDGHRKNFGKIKIPARDGYKIVRMIDEAFEEQKQSWQTIDNHFVLNTKQLPLGGNFLIEMQKTIDREFLNRLVFVKPTNLNDSDTHVDKYWLESSIKSVDMIKEIYSLLEIEKVDFAIDVDLHKMFKLAIPDEVVEQTATARDLLATAVNFDRNKLFRAAQAYKKQYKSNPPFDPNNFLRLIRRLTARETINDYITIERPYEIGTIEQVDDFADIIPQKINVHAITKLTLNDPIATGYLVFKRQEYIEKLKSDLKKYKHK